MSDAPTPTKNALRAHKINRAGNRPQTAKEMITTFKKWQQAKKTGGANDLYFCASGRVLSGRFFLCNYNAVTPSHDPRKGFAPSVGFPELNGQTVNDRDYRNDSHAQEYTRGIAAHFDGRAIQEPIIISADGVVLSGNGRTMAGIIAAENTTDGAYIDYLRRVCGRYGFTISDVEAYDHPRLVFVLDEPLPYTAETFALFNQDTRKGQDKTETAIKYGKTINDTVFNRIISTINGFETLSEYYANTEAVTRCVNDLRACGAIEDSRYNVIFDGDGISATGREMIENILTGKVFALNPDCVRICTQYKSIRRAVVFALAELANNARLGADYSLTPELCAAVILVGDARKAGYKSGEKVSEYARQTTIFGGTVADYKNADIMYFADMLNGDKYTELKQYLSAYNHEAKDAANGQTSLFGDAQRTKGDICKAVREMTVENRHGLISAATKERMSEYEFISQSKIGTVSAGGYAKMLTTSGASVTVKVLNVACDFADIEYYGGAKGFCMVKKLRPTAEHLLTVPEWLVPGAVISNGHYCQRVKYVTAKTVEFEWINGGCFSEDIAEVIKSWEPYDGVCEILEDVA